MAVVGRQGLVGGTGGGATIGSFGSSSKFINDTSDPTMLGREAGTGGALLVGTLGILGLSSGVISLVEELLLLLVGCG